MGAITMSRFQTTRWSLVLNAAGDPHEAHAALETLCRTYRAPVLAFVRCKVRDHDLAEDLTQAFFLEFLERGWNNGADPLRGRFRAYLLTAVKRFLHDQHVHAQRLKHGGGLFFESLEDQSPASEGLATPSEDSPEATFDRDWALAVLDAAMTRLRAEAQSVDKLDLFEHLSEFLTERPADADYGRVAAALNLRRNTLAVAVHRLRHRLRELVHQEIAQTADDANAAKQELHELRAALGSAFRS